MPLERGARLEVKNDGDPTGLYLYIDYEPWPPRLHGTGSEDYFNTGFGPHDVFNAPYQGMTVSSGTPEWPWGGKTSCYRYHIEDAIPFEKSIRVTMEHGEGNCLSLDISSTACWHQLEPHLTFPPLPGVAERLPRPVVSVWASEV